MNTRRDFLLSTSLLFASNGQAQSTSRLEVQLAKEFRGGWLLDAAPDSQKLALYFVKHPVKQFTAYGGKWSYAEGPSSDGKSTFEVIEIGSWRAQCAVRLRTYGINGSFHADSRSVYVGTDPLPKASRTQHVLIDLDKKNVQEHMNEADFKHPSYNYHALWPGALLAVESSPNLPHRLQSLLVVTIPEYREIARVPFALTDVFEGTLIGVLVTTADRRFVAHTAVNTRIDQSKGTVPGFSVISNTVIFRRTEDLSIVWSRELEAGNSRAERIAVSPDGKLVAVAVSGMTGPTSGRGHIEILNGPDGAQILRVPLFGGDGIALSPRGTVLAVGRISGERRGSILAADLYELSSMRKLATVEHDQWSKGRDLLHTTGFDNDGLQFTADGRHLLTSINGLVKVWRLQS